MARTFLEAFVGVGGEAAAIKYATEQAKMYKRKKKTKTGFVRTCLQVYWQPVNGSHT
jgi:hypothetical protein